MANLYKSRIGDTKTKQEWTKWFEDGFNYAYNANEPKQAKLPDDSWERVKRILKLELVEQEEWKAI